MSTTTFEWSRFHAYRVFDEYLERFIIHRKSYVTKHDFELDLDAAYRDIESRFVSANDDSSATFEDKVALQFQDAPEQSKIVFANVEYLWSMPVGNIGGMTKRSFALRWFAPDEVQAGERYFFEGQHTIADPGPWYLRNKYGELVAALRVLSLISSGAGGRTLQELKAEIIRICHSAIYQGVPPEERFAMTKCCSIHSALLHLCAPERFEVIISASHREQICAVLGYMVEDPSDDPERLLRQIREVLYDSYGEGVDPDDKYRWFFYTKDVEKLWKDKTTKRQQRASSAVLEVSQEEDAVELEGAREEVSGYKIQRSAKLVIEAKTRDAYTCQACGFHFKDQIVHVHHLDPISERSCPTETKLDDLITLCPNCHYLAHYLLRLDEDKYRRMNELIPRLMSLRMGTSNG